MSDMPLISDISPVFVGRRDQLRLLADQAERVRSGGPETLLVGGEAGVGKSRLVSEFVETRTRGAVFVGACLQLGEDGLSYAPFTAVLRQVLRDLGREVFETAAPGGIGEFARLLPELGEVPRDRRENRGILFEQLLRLFGGLGREEGVTIVLEDLHWADGATRDLLVFLVRNLDHPGVQIIGTYRSDDLHRSHPLRRLLPALERLPGVGRIHLEPLTREEVAAQARAIRGDDLTPSQIDSLYRRSEGVPLYVEALASAETCPTEEDPDLPDHFRDLLLEPLHRFDETAWTVLHAVATGAVGGGVEHETLYHAVGLPEREFEATLRVLVDANVLRVGRTDYRFRHALLRDAVHGEILPGPHARLHLRFAQLIDEYPDTVPSERRAAEQAHHYQAAHDLPRALQSAWWAAVRAGEALAFDEELAMLERVLDLWDRVPDARERVQDRSRAQVVVQAAGAALDSGRPKRALELLETALAEPPEDPEDDEARTLRAVLLRMRGQALAQGGHDGGLSDLVRALEMHPPHMPGYARLLATLAKESRLSRADREETPDRRLLDRLLRDGRGPRELAELAIEVAGREETADPRGEAEARITLGGLLMEEGDVERGRPLMELGTLLSVESADPMTEARGSGNLGHHLRELGRHEEGMEVLEESLARHDRLGWASVHRAFNHQNVAEILFEMGRLGEARELSDRTRTAATERLRTHCVLTVLARTAAAQGDLEAARRATGPKGDRSMLNAQRMNILQLDALASVDTSLAEGDPEEALDLARAILDRTALERFPGYTWPLLEAMAEAARQGDDPKVAERVLSVAERTDVVGSIMPAYSASIAALVAETVGDDAGPLWKDAVKAWEPLPMPLYLARARLREAEVGAARDRDLAVCRVRQVYATAVECGASPLAASAEGLARRLGVGVSDETPAPRTPAGLTARETEVLRLLAEGATNARIAEALFISPKTASVHVSNILAKLDVPNRATAGAHARRLGLA
ncbi:helix-turn-helix transcriptional regulator [Nocardiopsis alba]|uniref:AAA family ATPase n=2 Tax=Nocardiopsis alba TaxID=53437 RepID=A0ABV5DZR1_9ACTN|nr:helix-turn-helix transcriptional regulator [Nocardiopsis alba]AFR10294.1 bacterial regulatory s, luxR family protein [Nocardiopsis alba ATCC BAA-2165]